MKVNELRIGNWLDSEHGLVQVAELHLFNDRVGVKSPNFENFVWNISDSITSSPLTEEWLLKFGFKCIHKSNKHYTINDPNNIVGNGKISILPTINDQWYIAFSDNLNGYKDYISSRKIKYVHQLQNLYFELTGEELTIKN